MNENELMHYGVPGMKWGKRMKRGHAGPGRYLTKTRQLAGDKKDLEYLNKGGHLSVGLTKKRQAAYDAKDKARLEKRIAKNEAALSKEKTGQAEKKIKKPLTEKQKIGIAIGATAATTALATYGAYKLSSMIKDREKNRYVQNGIKAAKHFLDRGDGERAVSELIDHYNWSREDHKTLRKSIAYTIDNNRVGKNIDWKGLAKHYKNLK